MAYSYVNYTGDGSKVGPFSVPFPYIDKSHVHVYQMGTEVSFTWLTTATIELNVAPAENDIIHICRLTGREERLVNFQNGSLLNADTQNLDSKQLFYLMQEAFDVLTKATDSDAPIFQSRDAIIDLITGWVDTSVLAEDLSAKLNQVTSLVLDGDSLFESHDVYDGVFDVSVILSRLATAVSMLEELGENVSQAEIDINTAEADILLRAYQTEVTGIDSRLVTAEGDITDLGADLSGLDVRISQAEIDIDGAEAAITLKASQTEVTAVSETVDGLGDDLSTLDGAVTTLTSRVSQAEIDIDGAEAAILLKASQETVNTVITDLNTAEGNITTLDDQIASITTRVTSAEIDIDGAEGSITALVADVTAAEGDITYNAGEISLLTNEFMVKLDANGNVSGFGLYNGGTVSEFIVNADKFAFIKDDGTGSAYKPFVIDAISGLIAIDGSLVSTGSISAAQIAADAVTADKIYAGAVTADSIAADAIDGDHISASSEIVLSEGGFASFGDDNILIETEDIAGSEGRIIVAPNGGPTGQNYTVIDSGDITQYIWDGAAHRSYSPVTSGTGTANGSTAINIPGYWKKAPVVTVSPNTIQAYHPSYPSTAQTIQCSPGNVVLQSGSSLQYKFTPSISLSISSGSAWRALSVTDAHTGGALPISKTGTTRAVATPYTGVRQVSVSFNTRAIARVSSLSGGIWTYLIPTLQVYRAGAWVDAAYGAQQNSLNTQMYWTLTSSVQGADIQYYRVNWWVGPQNAWSGYYLYNDTTQGMNVNYTAETKYITGTTLASSGVVNWLAVGQD